MSSKILAADIQAAVRPMSWRTRTPAPQHHQERPMPSDSIVAELQAKLAETTQDAKNRIAEARRIGFEAGIAQARSEFDSEMRPLMQEVATQVQSLAENRSSLLKEAEESLADLALAIARRILHRELTIDPAAINGIVSTALRTLRGHQVLRVRVHPRLESYVRSAIQAEDTLDEGLEIVLDRTLGAEGLLFETQRGNLDASVETQLDEIRRGLTDSVSR